MLLPLDSKSSLLCENSSRESDARGLAPLLEVGAIEKRLAEDREFVGIGKAKARKLAEEFGENLHGALVEKHVKIVEILGSECASSLFVVYQHKFEEMEALENLTKLGVEFNIAKKVARVWTEELAVRLKENPYLLISFLNWNSVEIIGRKMGINSEDPRRLVAAVENVLYERLDEKHTLTSEPELLHRLSCFLGSDRMAQKAIEFAVEDYGAIAYEGGYQPAGAAAMESFVAKVTLGLSQPAIQMDWVAKEVSADELESALDDFDATQPFPLTDRQREAVAMAISERIGFLGGYAGSGKTTVLRAICDAAERFGRDVYLMALSGRAAKRISESTGRRAITIAGFLKQFQVNNGLYLGPEVMVIIDEASMIDLSTLYRLMKYIGQARLLMVGDPAQLPPIGFGLTFHTLIENKNLPHVVLDRVMRQTASSGIPAIANDIRHGRVPTLEGFRGLYDGVSFVECAAVETFNTIINLGRKLGSQGMKRGDCQIISPIKAGPSGITTINDAFHELLTSKNVSFPGRPDVAVGDPIFWTQNHWDRDLQNGSMGRIVSLNKDIVKAVIEGQEIDLSRSDANYLDLAYAISVHKAQGSQWERVIMPVFSSRILDRTLLYTALTRAEKQIIFIGSRESFNKAITNEPSVDRRETTLRDRLQC